MQLAIDDFGTGYSSLAYLRRFPVDILKIDRSFVSTIGDAEAMPAILRGLIDLGRTLDLEIVAEGIEQERQRTQLRDGQVGLAQGYLFAAPLEHTDAELLLLGGASRPPRGPAPLPRPDRPWGGRAPSGHGVVVAWRGGSARVARTNPMVTMSVDVFAGQRPEVSYPRPTVRACSPVVSASV